MAGRPKGTPATLEQAAAGEANLMKWKEEQGHPEPNRKHGAFSGSVRQRYIDLRTSEGQRLKTVIDALVEDLGGPESVNAAQNVLIGGLRSKFIVIFQIGEYLDRQSCIVNDQGELLACLGRNFLSYTESIRRDLETLYAISGKSKRNVPRLEELIGNGK